MSAAGSDPDTDPESESESERRSSGSASDVAEQCRDAGLVRLVATPDGDALAAVGLLARALTDRGVAFQASVREWDGIDSTTDADTTVAVGRPGGDVAVTAEPLAVSAGAAVRALGEAADSDLEPDAVLALAGAASAGDDPGSYGDLLAAAGVERDPGVALPTDDPADGLAHTTLVHAPFSGDPEAAAEALAGRDRDGRTVASLAALSAVAAGGSDPGTAADSDGADSGSRSGAPPRAATAVERALYPYRTPARTPFATLAGYGDVLDAVARERPGVGVALAVRAGRADGDGDRDLAEAALSAWREHARRAHGAVRSATTARYDGLVVADVPAGTGAALPTAARLLRDYRSPEPVVIAREGGDLAAAGSADRDGVERAAREAAAGADGRATGRGARARARVDESDREAFVAAFREAMSP